MAEPCAEKRMRQLGIREHEIGAADHERGSVLRVFSPEQTRGDTVDQFGRLYMDSGFLNPELTAQYGPGASAASRQASARDSIDAIIAHESTEASGLSHAEAIQRSGYCLIDLAECSPSRAVAKKAQNEANEKRSPTIFPQRDNVRWLRLSPRKSNPIPGR